jgi:hypothetical protein
MPHAHLKPSGGSSAARGKSHGLRGNGAEFPVGGTEQRKLARFLRGSDEDGEFSVSSQAVQRFTTACWERDVKADNRVED